jgi:hypothetical protein
MYVETYRQPFELQANVTSYRGNVEPVVRKDNPRREESIQPATQYDVAGRVPYEDLC